MADQKLTEAIVQMMDAGKVSVADIIAAMDPDGSVQSTVAEYAERCLTALRSNDSRRSYRTHLRRLCDGIDPVCSCSCVACATAFIDTGDCAWACPTCRQNPLTHAGLGAAPMCDATFVFSDLENFVALTERIATKRAIRDNAVRLDRGLGPMATHGQAARATCVNALSRLLRTGLLDGKITRNIATELKSGDAVDTKRRAVTDDELPELFDTVASGGDDPELDFLLTWSSFEMGNRRGGLLAMVIADISAERQIINLHEKGRKDREQPVSRQLLDALMDHARRRGGDRCVPDHADYDPGAPVFYYLNSTAECPHPLGRKRFETLNKRIQRSLPWAREMNFSLHCARHTAGTLVERIAGTQVARKFLGHGTRKVTDRYTNATATEVATAFSAMSGRAHPAATPTSDDLTDGNHQSSHG